MAGQFTAIIGLLEDEPAHPKTIEAALRKQIPGEASPPQLVKNSPADKAHLGYVVDFGGNNIVTVMYVNAAVPTIALDEAIAANAGHKKTPPSPELARITKGHYTITTVKEVEGVRESVVLAKTMTRVVAAIAQSTPTAFATWLSGASLVLQSNVSKLAEFVATGGYPMQLWMTMIPYEGTDRQAGSAERGLKTKGLSAFLGREINMMPTSIEHNRLMEHCEHMARYLLSEAAILSSGDVIGISPEEQIKIHLADHDGKEPTYDMTLQHVGADVVPIGEELAPNVVTKGEAPDDDSASSNEASEASDGGEVRRHHSAQSAVADRVSPVEQKDGVVTTLQPRANRSPQRPFGRRQV